VVNNIHELDSLIATHHNEASEGIVDLPPSRLNRGQGTQKQFHILKIDLANSTILLMSRHKATYLKLAHTFLSTVDKITKDYGADSNQTEYAGDSVLAYFPNTVSAENVLLAAFFAKVAVERIAKLQTDSALSKLNCRIVIHYASLIIAKIGPRAGSFLNAMGAPIHMVAKLEKEISIGVGRVTVEFYRSIDKANRKYFTGVYKEQRVLVPPQLVDYGLSIPAQAGLLGAFYPTSYQPSPQQPDYQIENILIGYDINWELLKRLLI